MKPKQGVIAAVVFLLACVYHLPAQSNRNDEVQAPIPPKPINLDVPPDDPEDPEVVQERNQALEAVRDPETFHEWVLSQVPDRRAQEADQAQAILNPSQYRRAHPKPPGLIQAEAVAAHAILNPHVDAPGQAGRN
jgi:hypothetical protein